MPDASTFLVIELDRAADAARRVLGDAGATIVDLDDGAAAVAGRTVIGAELAVASSAGPLLVELLANADPSFRIGLGGRDEAVALMRRARPGQALVGPTAVVVVGPGLPLGAELVSVGAERAYELRRTAPGAAVSNLGWAHRAAPELLVGREREIERLESAWAATLRGRRRPAVVSGTPGIGKTAVAAELALRVHAAGGLVLYGRWDRQPTTDHQAFDEAAGAYADGRTTERLRAEIDRHHPALRLLVPEIDLRLGLRTPPPAGRRWEAYEAVQTWLDDLAREQPVLVVLDDEQWADRPSQALLDVLRHSPGGAPWMVLTTARPIVPTGLAALHPGGPTVPVGAEQIDLQGLDEAALALLARRALGCPVEADSPLVAQLVADTAGNPLFVGQALGSPGPTIDVVAWRLAQLAESCRTVLADAAVIGSAIDVTALATVRGVTPAALRAEIEPAVHDGLLQGEGERYAFVHQMVRRALAEQVDPARVGQLHRRTAACLETHAAQGQDVAPARIAHHHLEGADATTAVHAVAWSRRGAESARQAHGYDEAVALLTQGLRVHSELAAPGVVDRTACELRIELAEAHDLAGHHRLRDEQHLAAADAARSQGATDLLVRAALGYGGRLPSSPLPDPTARGLLEEALDLLPDGDSAERVLLLARLAHIRHLDAPAELRAGLVDQAVAMARRLADQRALARALAARCLALDGPDLVDDCLAAGREVVAIGERLDDAELRLQGLRVQVPALLVAGRHGEARALAEDHGRLAAEVRVDEDLRIGALWDMFESALDGRHDHTEEVAQSLAARLVAEGHAQGPIVGFAYTFTPRWLHGQLERSRATMGTLRALDPESPMWWAMSVWLDASTGHPWRARHELERRDPAELVAGLERDSLWWPTVVACAMVAEVCRDPDWAAAVHRTLEPEAGRSVVAGYALFGGAVDHHLGALALILGRRDEAVSRLRSGLASHRSLGALPFVALSAWWLAHALSRGADAAGEVAALRTEAIDLQHRLGMDELPHLAAGLGAA